MTTRTTTLPAGEPTWFDLATPDVSVATAFYKEVFGWNYIDTGPDFGNYHFAQSDSRNVAGIGPIFPPDSPQPSAWTVYFATEDAAKDCERVKELGGQVLVEPMVIGNSGSMAICMDSTGAAFGFWQADQHIGSGAQNEHGSMCWCEVNTRDSGAARDFYTQLLNADAQKMEGADYYTTLHHGKKVNDDNAIAGILQMDENWEGIPPHWMPYFAIDNTDAAVKRAVAAGGQVRVEPFDMPHGRMAVVSDPAGAVFSIVQLPE